MARVIREFRGEWGGVVVAVLGLMLQSCSFDPTLSAGAKLHCNVNSECPKSRVCRGGFCIDPASIDLVAPELSEPIQVVPQKGRAGTVFSVALVSTKPLITTPRLTIHMEQPTFVECVTTNETLHYRCDYTAIGTENSGLGGIVDFDVRLVDTSGNETVKRFAGTLQMDFSPPVLAAATVSPEVARLGATLEVFVTSSEPLSGPVQLTSSVPLDDGAGGKVSTFSVNADGATLNYRLLHVVSSADPTGEVAFTAAMTDTVGNTSSALAVGKAQIDATVPMLRNAMVTPARAKVGATVTATFEVSKPLAGNPSVTVGSIEMVRDTSIAAPNYRYTYTVGAQDAEGLNPVLVTGTDLAGNAFSKNIGAVAFDFTAPKLAAVTALYAPDSSNVLATVTKAKAGTVVTIGVISDEPLSMTAGPGNPPTLTATFAGSTLTFCVVGLTCPGDTRPSSYTSTGVTFEVAVPQSAGDGVYVPTLTWTDLAGNTGTASFAAPTIQVKTSTPVLAVNQGQVTFVRSPWGNAAAENLGVFTIPAGAYFALAPANVLSNVSALPANTFSSANGVIQRLRVWTSAVSGSLLGTVVPNGDGTWPRQRLTNLDVPTAYVTAVDEAGNESTAVKLNNAEWVATANVTGLGANPNQLSTTTRSSSTLNQPLALLGAGADGADATAVLTRGDPTWSLVNVSDTKPSVRSGHAMAYDTARGRMVLFGGSVLNAATGYVYQQDAWEWDGANWVDKTPPGLKAPARSGHAMAYDSARGRVVMFGGTGGGVSLQDVWEWDGLNWVNKTPSGPKPAAGSGYAMAYDSARRCTVMFGAPSLQSVWEWDGVSWVEKTTSGAKPSARTGHAMAYDTARERVVMFGGSSGSFPAQDLWEWDGTSWVDRTPAGTKPSPRSGHAMAYDSERGRAVMFGGYAYPNGPIGGPSMQQDVWEWDGTNWVDKTPSGPKPAVRHRHALAFDAARRRVVMFGGDALISSSYQQDVWEWDGTLWIERTPSGEKPVARAGMAMAYDSFRARTVMFGGLSNTYKPEVWEWNGASWVDKTPLGAKPSGRTRHAMAYDSVRRRVVMFGGDDDTYKQDVWEWDGTVWVDKTPVGAKPSARFGHAMTYDAARGKVVMFGGDDGPDRQDLWEWDGTSWVDRTPVGTKPSPRSGHAMAYDSSRGRVVMFGGSSGLPRQDIWEWDGTSWVDRTPSGLKPTARSGHAMVYDAARSRVVLMGGYDAVSSSPLQDVWEWDGSAWADKTPTNVKAGARYWHAMTYDSARSRTVLFGGFAGAFLQDVWETDSAVNRQPAVGFLANAAGYVNAGNVSGLRVRAHCGGGFAPFGPSNVGATLYGWATGGTATAPGMWRALAVNSTGISASSPWLPAPNAALIDWTAASTTEARQFILERDSQLGFQCRPSGSSGVSALEASVALDYIEVRVRYVAP